jgi:hypothetical protein
MTHTWHAAANPLPGDPVQPPCASMMASLMASHAAASHMERPLELFEHAMVVVAKRQAKR